MTRYKEVLFESDSKEDVFFEKCKCISLREVSKGKLKKLRVVYWKGIMRSTCIENYEMLYNRNSPFFVVHTVYALRKCRHP